MALSQRQLQSRLHIDSFQNLPLTAIPSFVSAIPEMDKETAARCIEQFPNFKEYSVAMVNELMGLYREAMEMDHKALELNAAGYALILNDLHVLLNREHISEQERKYIIEKAIFVNGKLTEVINQHRGFLKDVLARAAAVTVPALAIGGALLGGKFFKK